MKYQGEKRGSYILLLMLVIPLHLFSLEINPDSNRSSVHYFSKHNLMLTVYQKNNNFFVNAAKYNSKEELSKILPFTDGDRSYKLTVAHYLARFHPTWITDNKEILILKDSNKQSVAHYLARYKKNWSSHDYSILSLNKNTKLKYFIRRLTSWWIMWSDPYDETVPIFWPDIIPHGQLRTKEF